MVTTDDDDLAAALRNLRLMRRGEGSLYDVTVAGCKANLSDVLAAVALCQLDKIEEHAEIRRRHVAAYDAAVAELPGIDAARPRPARRPRAPPLRRPHRRRGTPAPTATPTSARCARRTSGRASTSSRCTGSRTTASASPTSRAYPVAERAGDEVLSLPLSPAHSDADVEDAIDALRRVHARFTGR